MKSFTIAQNDRLLPIDILAKSVDELPLLLRLLDLEGVFQVLEYSGDDVEWVEESDPQDN